jgi:cytidine deaminase
MKTIEFTDAELISLAKKTSQLAYCPYSRFPVGAVVLTDDSSVFTGCNVENASYGLTMCAERNAIFRMVAEGGRKIERLVMYTPTATLHTPCGACRQVIHEFGPQSVILSVCDGSDRLLRTIDELLPGAFQSGCE